MFPYRKILELHSEGVSLRSIATITQHSRQKVTEVIKLAEKKGVIIPLDERITDPWLEDFLYPEKKQENSGRHVTEKVLLEVGGDIPAMSVEKGQWHRLECLESGTVILEMKDGAYEPIGAADVIER